MNPITEITEAPVITEDFDFEAYLQSELEKVAVEVALGSVPADEFYCDPDRFGGIAYKFFPMRPRKDISDLAKTVWLLGGEDNARQFFEGIVKPTQEIVEAIANVRSLREQLAEAEERYDEESKWDDNHSGFRRVSAYYKQLTEAIEAARALGVQIS